MALKSIARRDETAWRFNAERADFFSVRNGCDLFPRSSLERDACLIHEVDPLVTGYALAADPITAQDGAGRCHTIRPDLLVARRDGPLLVAIVPTRLRHTPAAAARIVVCRRWAGDHGHAFAVETEESLRGGYRLANARLLWRYARITLPGPVAHAAAAMLRSAGDELTIAAVGARLAAVAGDDRGLAYAYHLLYRGVIAADPTLPLGPVTRVWRAATRDGSANT